jgi:hypothetical protein
MGSKGVRPRKRRARAPSGPRAAAPGEDGWELQHSPYTFEGQIEGLRRFGPGLPSASRSQRRAAVVVVLAFLLPSVTALIVWLAR